MSRNIQSTEAHTLYIDRRHAGKEATLERHAARQSKRTAHRSFTPTNGN